MSSDRECNSRKRKPLTELVEGLDLAGSVGENPPITGISTDSRTIEHGDLFVAIRGFETDGHRYVADAVDGGARAVVIEENGGAPDLPRRVPVLRAGDTRTVVAALADRFYDHPSGHLTIVGVTGTNGKTTVTLMLDSIFRAAGYCSGVIGTIGTNIAGRWTDAARTTPEAPRLQALLAQMLAEGVTHVAMEVSSHALDLHRVDKCRFAAAVFTNLSPDHLDYHDTMDDYLRTKLRLFTVHAGENADGTGTVAAVNIDDPAGRTIREAARGNVITYGIESEADVTARSIELSRDGVSFDLVIEDRVAPVQLQLVGRFSVYNALAAAACSRGLGISREDVVAGLHGLVAVPGRFEQVREGQPFSVVVDYAHTPQALQNVLEAARSLCPRRLICVVGCGGDRDATKRPKMGKIATENADFTIITSDNPRSEDPLEIINQMRQGITEGQYMIEPGREKAIFGAVEMSQPQDLVLIAGKGHETYQEFADRRIDFDDREVARRAIHALNPK